MSSLNPIGIPFIKLSEVDSTNNYAMGLVREGMAHHGTAVFAQQQTRGKGQRNKDWITGTNQNIALSIIVEPQGLTHTNMILLSMATAVSTLKFINSYIPDQLSIKWPNDIYWGDRKAAGILIENVWQQNIWKNSIIGIGVNVNQMDFGELGSKAVSLKQITGKEYNAVELAKELCKRFEEEFQNLMLDNNNVIQNYKTLLYKKNNLLKFRKGNRVFEAVVKDVTISGQLVLEHAFEECFDVGEIEWLINDV